jgi:hypothetical protein
MVSCLNIAIFCWVTARSARIFSNGSISNLKILKINQNCYDVQMMYDVPIVKICYCKSSLQKRLFLRPGTLYVSDRGQYTKRVPVLPVFTVLLIY